MCSKFDDIDGYIVEYVDANGAIRSHIVNTFQAAENWRRDRESLDAKIYVMRRNLAGPYVELIEDRD